MMKCSICGKRRWNWFGDNDHSLCHRIRFLQTKMREGEELHGAQINAMLRLLEDYNTTIQKSLKEINERFEEIQKTQW